MAEFIIPVSFTISAISYAFIAKWYLYPRLLSFKKQDAFIPILFFHSFRYIGLAFLVPGVTAEVLDSRFSNPAAYGDLLASILALLSIMAIRLRWSVATTLVWIFNIEGTLDLLNAVFQGLTYIPAGHFGSTFFIPAVIVPALFVTHFLVFVLLLKKNIDNS